MRHWTADILKSLTVAILIGIGGFLTISASSIHTSHAERIRGVETFTASLDYRLQRIENTLGQVQSILDDIRNTLKAIAETNHEPSRDHNPR